MYIFSNRFQHRKIAIVVGFFAMGASASVALIPAGSDGATRLFAQASSALETFIGRSPGERDDALVRKGKGDAKGDGGEVALGRVVEPEQEALGKVFDTPVEDALADLLQDDGGLAPAGDAGLFGDPGLVSGGSGSQAALGAGSILPAVVGGFPGGVGVTTPAVGGGGGGGGGGGTDAGVPTVTTTPPGVVSPVPEPSVWILMLIGFGFAGGAMRRRSAADSADLVVSYDRK